ncbi:hypothetical protein HYV86_03400 [Candidatus Woesearchaeota archaeon]|nr:hypothetical protein [Candidatus Woesearchaeota archaeon]
MNTHFASIALFAAGTIATTPSCATYQINYTSDLEKTPLIADYQTPNQNRKSPKYNIEDTQPLQIVLAVYASKTAPFRDGSTCVYDSQKEISIDEYLLMQKEQPATIRLPLPKLIYCLDKDHDQEITLWEAVTEQINLCGFTSNSTLNQIITRANPQLPPIDITRNYWTCLEEQKRAK